ncbi:MAG: hypothetical protein KJ607_07530, partial [Bacteroidetes bacterium]|nr:hypothetical protein [Bacteroidota bacterium]
MKQTLIYRASGTDRRRTACILILQSIAIVLLCACSRTQEITRIIPPLITPPLPGLQPEFNRFTADASAGAELSIPSGTTIIIPENAFADSSGNPVNGIVDIRYREFHDAVDILLSGIPMKYETGDKSRNMQTAGMFEIHADKDGRELRIADGKSITVRMASYETGNEYSFFCLDESARKWTFLDHSIPEVNEEKEALRQKVTNLRASIKNALDPEQFVFNYNSILDVYFNDDWEKINKNRHSTKIKNKATGYGLDWSDIFTWESIAWKGNRHRAALMVWKKDGDTRFPSWAKEASLNDDKILTHLGGSKYRLTLKNSKTGKIYSAEIEAVMPLKALFAFSPEYWKTNYDQAMSQVEEEEARLRLQADVFRTFEIEKFGIYNYDKLQKEENSIRVLANFIFRDIRNEKLTGIDMVFCIPGDNKTVIKYPKEDWGRIVLIPDQSMRFLAVLPGNRIAVYSAEKYRSISF